MQLLSLNDIRSLHNRLPPSRSPVEFAQAVVNLVGTWAQRTQRPYRSFTVDATWVRAQWEGLTRAHSGYDAAVQLAQTMETLVLSTAVGGSAQSGY